MKYKYTFKINNSYDENIRAFNVVVIGENINEAKEQAEIIARNVGLISCDLLLILVEELK